MWHFPFANAMQRGVLQSGRDMVVDCEVPGELRDLPHEWDVTFGYAPGKSGM